jgi:hypothetical protein
VGTNQDGLLFRRALGDLEIAADVEVVVCDRNGREVSRATFNRHTRELAGLGTSTRCMLPCCSGLSAAVLHGACSRAVHVVLLQWRTFRARRNVIPSDSSSGASRLLAS